LYYLRGGIVRATQAVIHLQNIAHNVREIKKLIADGVKICTPVKADAYGHGAIECAKTALASGADCLGVATADEGSCLRQAGINSPIVLFTLPAPEETAQCVRDNLEPFVYEDAAICRFETQAAAQNKRAGVHLKIDTGMGRAGCKVSESAELAKKIARSKHLALLGVCTHFAASDSLAADDEAFTNEQFLLFMKAVSLIKNEGIDAGLLHCAASGAVMRYPHTHLDMVRPGIMTYGYYPGGCKNGAPELAQFSKARLKPVMELVTEVAAIKSISAGQSVSYGRTWTALDEQKIAVLPVGYGDGLRRDLSPGLAVSVEGASCKVAGRICMDQCMISLKGLEGIAPNSRVVIFGGENSACMDAASLAEIAGTIPYEILCGISKRVPRVYV
jgi:alanine racemase